MSATEEMRHTVAQANAALDDNGKFKNELVSTRQNGDYTLAQSSAVDLIDVSPKQLVSVAASLIPFLENDDANRALDGLEHATPGGAIAEGGSAFGWHRH